MAQDIKTKHLVFKFCYRSLQTVNSLNFYDAINSEWLSNSNDLVGNIEEEMEDWVKNRGYPIVNVELRPNELRLTQV